MRFLTASSRPLGDHNDLGPGRQPWMMAESIVRYNIPLEISVRPVDWSGRRDLPLLIEQLARMPDDEIVLATDCWDAFFAAGAAEIEAKFRAARTPILFSAEWVLFPEESREYGDYPRGPTRWQFINGGGWMAYAGAFLAMLRAPDFWPSTSTCNQMAYHHWYLGHRDRIQLDYYCQVFLVLADWGRTRPPLESVLSVQHGRIINRETGSQPCVVHGPGGNALRAAAWWQRIKDSPPAKSQRQKLRIRRAKQLARRKT